MDAFIKRDNVYVLNIQYLCDTIEHTRGRRENANDDELPLPPRNTNRNCSNRGEALRGN